jgi:uncharacterized membrane protein YjgN (DUF898 family)
MIGTVLPLVLGILGAWLIAFPWLASRSTRFRRSVLAVYRNPGFLLPIRVGAVIAPVMGVAVLMIAASTVLERSIGVWVAWPGLALVTASIALAYRPPHALMPGWLSTEIASGAVEDARPDLHDWAFLILVLPVCVIGVVAFPFLALTA